MNEGFQSPVSESEDFPVFVSPHHDDNSFGDLNPVHMLKRKRSVSDVDIYPPIYPCKRGRRDEDDCKFVGEEEENECSQFSDSCSVSLTSSGDTDGEHVDTECEQEELTIRSYDENNDVSSCESAESYDKTKEESQNETRNTENSTKATKEKCTNNTRTVESSSDYCIEDNSDSSDESSTSSSESEGIVLGRRGCIVVHTSPIVDEPSSVSDNDHDDSSRESTESSICTTSVCDSTIHTTDENEGSSSDQEVDESVSESGSSSKSSRSDSDNETTDLSDQDGNNSSFPLPKEVSIIINQGIWDEHDCAGANVGDEQCDLSIEDLDNIMSASQCHSADIDSDLEFSDDEQDQ